METTTKSSQERALYIKKAKIEFSGDYARVVSQTDETRAYPVRVIGGKASRCECDDYFYRGRQAGKACKHMDAVDMRIEKDAAKAARKAAKAAKSAEIVASLQIASGMKVRKVKGQTRLVAKPVQRQESTTTAAPLPSVAQPPTLRQPLLSTGGGQNSKVAQPPRVETGKLQIALSKPVPPLDDRKLFVRGNLSSNRGFSLMR